MCAWPAPFGWYCSLEGKHHGRCALVPKRWNIIGRLEGP